MLTINLENKEYILNLHSFGEGVRHYSVFNRDTAEGHTETEYDGDTRVADENVIKDAALMLEQGWRVA